MRCTLRAHGDWLRKELGGVARGTFARTSTICRKCYVHPEVLNSYMDGNLVLELKSKAEASFRAAWLVSSPKRLRSSRCCAAVSRRGGGFAKARRLIIQG